MQSLKGKKIFWEMCYSFWVKTFQRPSFFRPPDWAWPLNKCRFLLLYLKVELLRFRIIIFSYHFILFKYKRNCNYLICFLNCSTTGPFTIAKGKPYRNTLYRNRSRTTRDTTQNIYFVYMIGRPVLGREVSRQKR